jgi:hypothetical protein
VPLPKFSVLYFSPEFILLVLFPWLLLQLHSPRINCKCSEAKEEVFEGVKIEKIVQKGQGRGLHKKG